MCVSVHTPTCILTYSPGNCRLSNQRVQRQMTGPYGDKSASTWLRWQFPPSQSEKSETFDPLPLTQKSKTVFFFLQIVWSKNLQMSPLNFHKFQKSIFHEKKRQLSEKLVRWRVSEHRASTEVGDMSLQWQVSECGAEVTVFWIRQFPGGEVGTYHLWILLSGVGEKKDPFLASPCPLFILVALEHLLLLRQIIVRSTKQKQKYA